MAIECGIPYKVFFKSTPYAIKVTAEAFWRARKNDWERAEYQAWLTGKYVQYAIGASFSRKNKYPKNPMEEEKVIVEDMELTEEEKAFYTEKLFEKLENMAEKNRKYKEQNGG